MKVGKKVMIYSSFATFPEHLDRCCSMLFLGVCQWRRPQNAPIFCDFSIGHLILKTLEASKKNGGFDPKPNLGGGLEHVFMTFHILRIITPTDFHMFQWGRLKPPTRNISKHWVEIPSN